MQEQFSRTALLVGENGIELLNKASVLVFGVGGVGGYVVEALTRAGVGTIDICDNDTVSITNLNRQIVACTGTVGKYKVDVMRERMKDINPNVNVTAYKCFYLPESRDNFDFKRYDYIVDAIDTVTAKIDIAVWAQECGVPVISACGTGNKLDASAFEVADIYDTSVCPLAKVMRRELKRRGVNALKVVYSKEIPLTPDKYDSSEVTSKRSVPGSMPFVPPVAGMIMAGEVIKDLLKKNGGKYEQ